jgi:hypothetical protein
MSKKLKITVLAITILAILGGGVATYLYYYLPSLTGVEEVPAKTKEPIIYEDEAQNKKEEDLPQLKPQVDLAPEELPEVEGGGVPIPPPAF